ncbi:hypothetical protein BDN71DRAFT_1235559 [Pleurotus eryngii]|uniref:Uncharacterized protein n=1 Tax=Pleurotus eryngii TaxID=5323 RepID=A0A9P5ZPX7_PLEER|nr:hypothetical protein BDN71DRAFT_1235559 [Pleurotus eryngii]
MRIPTSTLITTMLAMSCALPSLCSPIADPRILIPQVVHGEARRDVASSRQPLIDLHVLEKRGLFGLLGGIVSIIPIVGLLLGGALQSIDTAITSSINELKAKKSASASQNTPTHTTLAVVATAQATYVHVPTFRKQAALPITTQVIAGPVAPTFIASTSWTDSTTAAPTYVTPSTTSCDETSAVFTTSPVPQTTRAPVVTKVIAPTPIRSASPIAKESDCDT